MFSHKADEFHEPRTHELFRTLLYAGLFLFIFWFPRTFTHLLHPYTIFALLDVCPLHLSTVFVSCLRYELFLAPGGHPLPERSTTWHSKANKKLVASGPARETVLPGLSDIIPPGVHVWRCEDEQAAVVASPISQTNGKGKKKRSKGKRKSKR